MTQPTTVSLEKGGKVSLDKLAPNLTKVEVGLGWDARTTTGSDFDLDASAIATGADKKVLSDKHFVFYNNLKSPEGAITHSGDDLTGGNSADGDDEVITIDLASAKAAGIESIFFPVTIHKADERKQNFGQVNRAYIRAVDPATGSEMARFDLGEDYATETALIFGKVYYHDGEWKFGAVGDGYASGLKGIATDFGVHVG